MTLPHANDKERLGSVSPEVLLYNLPEVRVDSVLAGASTNSRVFGGYETNTFI